MKVTFVLWDPETDGVAVKHDGDVVWRANSLSYLDQYFRFFAPDQSVLIDFEDGEGVE